MRHPGQLKRLRSLTDISGTHLGNLKLKASIHALRVEKVLKVLPKTLSDSVQIGGLTHGLLTIYVPAATVATELRFQEEIFLQKLSTDPLFGGLKRIQCKVRPIGIKTISKTRKERIFSESAAKIILDYSETLSDEKLKHQFQKLAEQVSGNPEPDQT